VKIVLEVGEAVAVGVGSRIGEVAGGRVGVESVGPLPGIGEAVAVGILGAVAGPVFGPGVRAEVARGVDDAGEVSHAPPVTDGPGADLVDDPPVDDVLPRERRADVGEDVAVGRRRPDRILEGSGASISKPLRMTSRSPSPTAVTATTTGPAPASNST